MAEFVIAGGGIGGLAAALSIARQGHRVEVLERNDTFAELGAGIQLAPNAFHALDRLGVGARVRAAAVQIDALRLLDARSGDSLATLPLGPEYRRRFGNPYAVVHRGDLYAPLLEACREHEGIVLRAGVAVAGYEHTPSGVRVLPVSGMPVEADGLIGADGIRSVVRTQLVGDGPPRVSGHTIHRAVVPMDHVPPALRFDSVCLWAGPGWHFVHYPITSGRKLNLAITRDDGARVAVSAVPTDREQVLAGFPDLHDTARRLLALGRGWRTWVLCDRPAVATWTDGRVVLTGDAAHPMLQYAAQGACMALEDAVLLGDLLDRPSPGIAEQFAAFNAERRDRTARAQEAALWMGRNLYHPQGDEAEARDKILAGLSPGDLMDAVSWLHAHRC
ncbi:FAD-dependent monooxygenase [Streptomyces sp. SID2888]|uniref:FAD-dependent monooxygenase n=1 Tax=Streptomyces sp. SID2888 TaxID=2690256 RepID=UPI001368021D|nr:NAD(P)-binding protein [Streptomyces sp. SID2888]